MRKKDRCAVFGCNNDRLFPEKYTLKFSFCPKSARQYSASAPGHPIMYMAAVSVKKVYYKLRPDCLSIWLVCALNSYLYLLLHSATSNPFIFVVILSGPSCSKGRYRYSPDKSLSSRYTGYLSTEYRCIRWAIALSIV